METIGSIRKINVLFFVSILSFTSYSFAQTRYTTQKASISVSGTSSLHDWTEKSNTGTGVGVFTLTGDKLTALNGLSIIVPAKSLKSEHNAMDNNTYKALKADKNPNITYVAATATVTPVDATTFTIKTTGHLTIAGASKLTDITATAKINPDKSITVSGSKKFKMTDYGITPPTAVFGTIKTGNDVTISYTCRFTQ